MVTPQGSKGHENAGSCDQHQYRGACEGLKGGSDTQDMAIGVWDLKVSPVSPCLNNAWPSSEALNVFPETAKLNIYMLLFIFAIVTCFCINLMFFKSVPK